MPPQRLSLLWTVSERLPRSPYLCLTKAQCTGDRGQPQRAVVLEGDCVLAGQARPQGPGVLPCSCRDTSGGGPALPPWGWRWYFLPLSPTVALTWSSGQLGPGCPSAYPPLSLLLPSRSLYLTPDPLSLSPSGILQDLRSLSPSPPSSSPPSLLLLSCSACFFRCPAVCLHQPALLSGSLGPHLSLSLPLSVGLSLIWGPRFLNLTVSPA